jgi:hypothetical protein
MNDPDHERLREIEASAQRVDTLRCEFELRRADAREAKEAWEEAVERHLELCRATEESQDVAKAPLLRQIEERGAEANGQPIVADAVTEPPEPDADHEVDEPDWHGEAVGHPLDRSFEVIGDQSNGWDLVTSRPLSDDAKAEADALAAIEAGSKKAKGRKGKKGGS